MRTVLITVSVMAMLTIANDLYAQSVSNMRCWGGITTSDQVWTGEERAVEFIVNIRELVARRTSFSMDVPASQIPGAAFKGGLRYFAQKLDSDGPPMIGIGVFHLPDDQSSFLGQAVASYPANARRIFLKGDSYALGLETFTLSCTAEKRAKQ